MTILGPSRPTVPETLSPWPRLPNESAEHSYAKTSPVGPNSLLENAAEILRIHYQIVTEFTVQPIPMENESNTHTHLCTSHASIPSEELELKISSLFKLRKNLKESIAQFESRCQTQAIAEGLIKGAKYLICSFMDETILTHLTNGLEASADTSLVNELFDDPWGGEVFFKIHQFSLQHLPTYLDLLEMSYVFICLGFQGKYAIESHGLMALQKLKQSTYEHIAHHRGLLHPQDISPCWRSDFQAPQALPKSKALQILTISLLIFLGMLYAGLSYFLNLHAQETYQQIKQYLSLAA